MTTPKFSAMTLLAIDVAIEAGDILIKQYNADYKISYKPGNQNIVTSVDHASENLIISKIKQHFPSHGFLAEESGYTKFSDDSIIWIIDPLDGTTNYARQIPLFSISLAAYHKSTALCSVIYQPITRELFVAEKGKGAYLNGQPINCSQITEMKEALIISGLSYHDFSQTELITASLMNIKQEGVNLRHLGSAALSLAYVAAGKAEACWIHYLCPWDLAAGKLLVEEAGGKIAHLPIDVEFLKGPSEILASNSFLYQSLLEQITF